MAESKHSSDPEVHPLRYDTVTKELKFREPPQVPEPTPVLVRGRTLKEGKDKDVEIGVDGGDLILTVGSEKVLLDRTARSRFGKVAARADQAAS